MRGSSCLTRSRAQSCFFFFNDTATTEIYTLSLHDALPIMNDAARHYVPIRDLTRATGERIAQLTGNDAALVTTGAAGAIFVGTCACIGGTNAEKMKRLPFTEGMTNEGIVQKLHNTGWTRQC